MITLLDGFVDEPSCLGVPPYISPYVRYIAGAIKDAGEKYEYITIEEWRKGREIKGDILVILAGAVVPGRYLRGMPISFREFQEICKNFKATKILVGSAVRYGFGRGGGKSFIDGGKYVDYSVKKDGDAFLYEFLNGEPVDRLRTKTEWRRWSILGAEIVKQHPDYPQPLIAEIETYRGCVRWFTGGCSFCIEPLFGKPLFRDENEIIKEVEALVAAGVTNFRIGGQSCFFSYKAKGVGESECPMPNIDAIRRLLEGISKMQPKVLHIDNVNPSVVANWEEKSREIARLVVKYCTPGNVAAFGMESADKKVIEENNLNATPEEVLEAVKIINEEGGIKGWNGLPSFLPGINIIYGLRGERRETYIENYRLLKEIKEKGYLLRRINIRQLAPFRERKTKINKEFFKRFKRMVNEKINLLMLKKMLPTGSILRDVYLEIHKGNYTFGRQVGSYPILVCLPYKNKLERFIDVKIIGHSFKSVTALEYPLDVNSASFAALNALPYTGRKMAAKIIRNRPFKNIYEVINLFNDKNAGKEVAKWIVINH